MQQKNQAPMSEEEQEGEVIDRRNTEEISLFPHPSFPLLRPIQPCDVNPCRVILRRAPSRVTEEGGARRSVRLPSLVILAHPPSLQSVLEQEVSSHTVPRPPPLPPPDRK